MFDWQTEDETLWEDLPTLPQTAEPRRKRPWLNGFLVAVAVLALLLTIYRQIRTEVGKQTTAVEQEVLAAHRFAWDVAAKQESELFRAQLSGRDSDWTEVQVGLVERGWFLNRAPFGLRAVSPTAATTLTTTLNPEFTAAEVTAVYSYDFLTTNGVTKTVQLQQTVVYRLSKNRQWLLSPPLNDFWGGWATVTTQHLTLIYPQRDAVVAEKLAFDLDALLRRVCRELPGLDCPTDLHIQLRLDNEPESLLHMADFAALIQDQDGLELPAPTLVGLPIDETGYEILKQGYGAKLILTVITQLVGYECCNHLAIYAVLVEQQLAQLGLRPWPMNPDTYEVVYRSFEPFSAPYAWSRKNLDLEWQEWLHLYVFVEYLLETADATPIDLLQRLSTSSNYINWLLTIFPGNADYVVQLDTHLRNYAFQHSTSGLMPPPIPLPAQNIALSCGSRPQVSLYEYRFVDSQWTKQFTRESYEDGYSGFALPLPDGTGYAVQEQWQGTENPHARVSLWRPNEEVVVMERTETEYMSMYVTNWWGNYPENHWLINLATENGATNEFWVFKPSLCHVGRCEVKQIMGWPVWSPDETQTLITVAPLDWGEGIIGYDLYRGDSWGQAAVKVGEGNQVFWLGNEHYIYARSIDETQVEWSVASIEDDVPHLLFRAEDFLPAIPEAERPFSLAINDVRPRPYHPDQILVSTNNPAGEIYYFLWQQGQIFLLRQDARPGWAEFSPNGRWVYFAHHNRYGTLGTAELYDLENDVSVTLDVDQFFWPSWSADEEWLVYNNPDERMLGLYAPVYDYLHLIPYHASDCFNYPFWLEDE